MAKDRLFAEREAVTDFDFGEQTAAVFDDMLERSIPQYRELQRMIAELACEFAQDDSNIYDLGCSTGITLRTLVNAVDRPVAFIGVDNSEAMLAKARDNFAAEGITKDCRFVCGDLNEGVAIENASVVVLNLTLQFVRPLYRDTLIRNIHAGLRENGALIVIEKVLGNDSLYNRMFIKFYYDMKKRHGYSDIEIARKREALENVLIPYRVDENLHLLGKSGFEHMDIFFKWYNFCGFLAVK